MAKLADAEVEQWDTMSSLNVKTTWNIYRAAVPAMRQAGGGALVGIGSAAGLKGTGEMAAYSTTKCAVIRLTESVADELPTDRIRVNPVPPTTIGSLPRKVASTPVATPRSIAAMASQTR